MAVSYLVLVVLVAIIAPSFLQTANLRDLAMNNAAVLIVAVGMTLVILTGRDRYLGRIPVRSLHLPGWFTGEGWPSPLMLLPVVVAAGALMGAVGGWFCSSSTKMPSIVVTLALMVAWRDGLRWVTEGTWVQDLPANFQWFGLGQTAGQIIVIVLALACAG